MYRALLLPGILLLCASLCLPALVRGQASNLGDDVATPIPGAGHDYIHLLSETVNPANGTVSVNINLPTAPGRGISLPFSVTYNSGPASHLDISQTPSGAAHFTAGKQGGWSNSLPYLTFQNWALPWSPPPHVSPGTCYFSTGYTFYDPTGAGHALGLATTSPPVQSADNCSAISSIPGGFTPRNYGGDSQVQAAYTYACGDSPAGLCTFGMPPAKIFDAAGTIYSFPNLSSTTTSSPTPITPGYWPSTIEDRNGNTINVSVGSQNVPTFKDTAGRTLVSANNPTAAQPGQGFAPTVLTVGGLTFNLTYKSAASSFTMSAQSLASPSGFTCAYTSISGSGGGAVISVITLPDSQTYQFFYDPTYGLLNEVIYPDGGWVKYTWKPSDQLSEATAFDAIGSNGSFIEDGCNILYKTPVVATRQVGFTGSTTPVLTQTFAYATAWNGLQWTTKTTTVQTTDNVTGKTAETVYTYTSIPAPVAPNTHQWIAQQIAVESQTQYYDWGGTSPIRTVKLS